MTDDAPEPQVSDARAKNASDIARDSWQLRILPQSAKPYARMARLDRPIGTWLLLLPCWQGMALAIAVSGEPLEWRHLWLGLLFGVGALVMRGAGCTQNDIADRDIDGRIARTALRPIPSGEIPVRRAVLFMIALVLIGGLILLQFNWDTVIVGLISIPFAAIYPFMKRITWWPQLFLGLAFNWGALVGWTAIAGPLELPAYLLYAAGVFWTLGYDTIYAYQDIEDDAVAGVKSTARLFESNSRNWITSFYIGQVGWLVLMGFVAGLHWSFLIGVAALAWHLMNQATTTDLDNPADCLKTFKSNRDAGLLLIAALALAAVAGA